MLIKDQSEISIHFTSVKHIVDNLSSLKDF